MRAHRFSTIFLFSFLLAGAASAQIVQNKGGYLIFVKYKKGQSITQDMGMSMVGNKSLKSTSRFVTKCVDVDKKGNSTVDVTVSAGGKVTQGSKRLRVDNHGKPLGSTIDGYSGTFVWPDTPIKMGQSWVGNITMADTGQNNGGAIKSTYKLAGIKSINGVKVASIAAVLSVGGSFDVAGTGIIYVRFSDGQMHSADFDLGLKQFTQDGSPKRLKLKMTIKTVKG